MNKAATVTKSNSVSFSCGRNSFSFFTLVDTFVEKEPWSKKYVLVMKVCKVGYAYPTQGISEPLPRRRPAPPRDCNLSRTGESLTARVCILGPRKVVRLVP